MRIAVPVTDYIPASILTTLNDLVIRGATDPERHGQLSCVYAYKNNPQNIPDGIWTLFELNGVIFDVNSEFTPASHWFIPNRDKYIFVSAGVKFVGLVDTCLVGIRILNGATLVAEYQTAIGALYPVGIFASCNMKIVTTDALTISIFQGSGAAVDTLGTEGTNWLSIIEIPVVP